MVYKFELTKNGKTDIAVCVCSNPRIIKQKKKELSEEYNVIVTRLAI